jgi:hypothetical protein
MEAVAGAAHQPIEFLILAGLTLRQHTRLAAQQKYQTVLELSVLLRWQLVTLAQQPLAAVAQNTAAVVGAKMAAVRPLCLPVVKVFSALRVPVRVVV